MRKGKKDGIAVALFILINVGFGLLPCAGWVRYGVSAFAVMGYARMCYKKRIVKAGEDVFILFDEKPDLLWKVPMIAVLIFVGEAGLIYFWQRYRILLAERQKHFVEEQQVKAMKKRLEEAENFYGSIRKVRHEMKNHMANIKGLAGAGEYGEIVDYVGRMDETMQELEYKYVTGNAVTDVIINDKCHRAEKAGIQFDADFRYSGEVPVFDLGIILNNLLDNAIEACEKLEPGKRFIRLTMKRKNIWKSGCG